MDMSEYLKSTKYAATTLIELINAEQKAIDDLRRDIKEAKIEADDWWEKMPQGNTLEDYIWYSEQSIYQSNLAENLKEKLHQKCIARGVKETSLTVLSGALLQIAKQGVSIVHSNAYLPQQKCGNEIKNSSNNKIPWDKPSIGTVNLKVSDLIVAARNQSLHYEAGLDNSHNLKVFEALESANPRLFQKIEKTDLKSNGGNKEPKNFAKNVVISLLKWKSYSQFETDLLSIG